MAARCPDARRRCDWVLEQSRGRGHGANPEALSAGCGCPPGAGRAPFRPYAPVPSRGGGSAGSARSPFVLRFGREGLRGLGGVELLPHLPHRGGCGAGGVSQGAVGWGGSSSGVTRLTFLGPRGKGSGEGAFLLHHSRERSVPE